ncbi:hypothetical protein GGG87_02330 [Streptococcus sp. zg-86]|uniref:Phage protein n=1 Tax=Streptococcus zhangguiae TaxID=2664091 RepID=A0A6I4RSP1_9STRE|nr:MULTISPECIES: hypothetical protein [unclassified Streptococcus]MTB63850.1 hypothetical protein [Streptococcus sp. zg-86]MTB90160.1 hypothetical protein [Streptococcus sp. zg-36]MWV55832.1 hypothetical protein [Streptococcus sp. zg-70]QTH47886.1 hypothetical protein J5M87_00670 [Streptococcus sp. zg-86]
MPTFNHVLMNKYHYQTGATRFDTIDNIKLGIQGYIIGLYPQPDVEITLTKLDAGWRLVAEYEADRDLTESLERIANTYKKNK